MNENVWKISCSWILVSSTSMAGVANAACTPTPDCANIGYTETSCDGDSLKCPFDISKLFCVPCDSSFKYDCSGANMTGGVGSSCGGKYMSCSCSGGVTFNNGECPQICTVGMLYYSDKSCSTKLDDSKTAIGIVVKDNELIVALNVPDMMWAPDASIDVSEINNITSLTATKTDYAGKANTLAIVSTYPNNTISDNVAIFCNSYSTTGTSAGDWYLPAMGELYDHIFLNYATIASGWDKVGVIISDNCFWSSSEYSSYRSWRIKFSNSDVYGTDKYNEYSVACLHAIN